MIPFQQEYTLTCVGLTLDQSLYFLIVKTFNICSDNINYKGTPSTIACIFNMELR